MTDQDRIAAMELELARIKKEHESLLQAVVMRVDLEAVKDYFDQRLSNQQVRIDKGHKSLLGLMVLRDDFERVKDYFDQRLATLTGQSVPAPRDLQGEAQLRAELDELDDRIQLELVEMLTVLVESVDLLLAAAASGHLPISQAAALKERARRLLAGRAA